MIEVFAPAKLNLCLHVTGLRKDGYHYLDTLVLHTDVGDRLTVSNSPVFKLKVSGPFGHLIPSNENNLVYSIVRCFGLGRGVEIFLEKNLPPSSGIGGGSSDAAAVLRALRVLWDIKIPDNRSLSKLGADIPVCMSSQLTQVNGIGEKIKLMGQPPLLDLVLVNPRVELSTPKVFAALKEKSNPHLGDISLDTKHVKNWIKWLESKRNDLERPAIQIQPLISKVLNTLKGVRGCLLARMSGSGATCFAVMDSKINAKKAVIDLKKRQPDWWVVQSSTYYKALK